MKPTDKKLIEASISGSVEAAKEALSEGANINATNISGWTALHYACDRGNSPVVKLLIESGADVQFFTPGMSTPPILWAALRGQIDTTEMLLRAGADINTSDNMGHTALHYACSSGSEDLAKLLVAKGADIGAKASNGNTPLHKACSIPNLGIIKTLIEAGADVNQPNASGQTPFDMDDTGVVQEWSRSRVTMDDIDSLFNSADSGLPEGFVL